MMEPAKVSYNNEQPAQENISSPPPPYTQRPPLPTSLPSSNSNTIGTLNRQYIAPQKPFLGILRVAIILSLFFGWISAAAAVIVRFGGYDARAAYLTFSIIGFLISIAVFVLNLFSFEKIQTLIVKKIIFISDIVFLISMLIVSIMCFVAESRLSWYYAFSGGHGAFASAGVFGFISVGFYGAIVFFQYSN